MCTPLRSIAISAIRSLLLRFLDMYLISSLRAVVWSRKGVLTESRTMMVTRRGSGEPIYTLLNWLAFNGGRLIGAELVLISSKVEIDCCLPFSSTMKSSFFIPLMGAPEPSLTTTGTCTSSEWLVRSIFGASWELEFSPPALGTIDPIPAGTDWATPNAHRNKSAPPTAARLRPRRRDIFTSGKGPKLLYHGRFHEKTGFQQMIRWKFSTELLPPRNLTPQLDKCSGKYAIAWTLAP